MEHPFVGDLSDMSIEQLTEKISALGKALSFTARTGKYEIAQQIQLAINSYRSELNRQQQKLIEDDSAITGSINIT